MLLCGCSKEEVYPQENAGNAVGAVLSLQVSADAYRSSAGTRATESELATTFTNGDQLCVIVTYEGQTPEHFVYTYNGSAWTSSTPAYYDYTGVSYAAYYPYRKELDGKSLADVKKAFTPLTDQSDYATGYAASDLMTCESATLNQTEKKLSISLTHAFSMLRMKASDVPVKSKCADNNTYEYSAPPTDIAFYIDNTPYRAWVDNDGYARVIVPGSSSSTTVENHYTVLGKRVKVSADSSLASGECYTITLPTATTDLGEYTLSDARMGDFYCVSSTGNGGNGTTTGFVLPQEAALPNALKSSCIGIVMKVGRGTDEGVTGSDSGEANNWKDTDSYKDKNDTDMPTIHGYVLALYDANGGSFCTWGPTNTNVGTNQSQYTLFCGYSNTQKIKSKVSNGSSLQDAFPAAYYASVDYETRENGKYSSPNNSSGWFLPSSGQCWYWYQNRYLLLASVRKATGNSNYSWNNSYWSSSESNSSPADRAWYVNFSNGYVLHGNKGNDYGNRVRSCLAF